MGVRLSKHIPCEADLNSAVAETWANAVGCCKGGAPFFCGADGYCHQGGECFEVKEMTLDQALIEIEHLNKELDVTRVKANQAENDTLRMIARLESAKEQAIKERKTERVFALRQCLTIIKRK